MATPVEMPKLGNTVEECILTHWLKQSGDTVAEGEVLAEIETDKTTFELTAPVGGILLGTFFQEGDLVPVFQNVCVVGNAGESIDDFKPQPSAALPSAKLQNPATSFQRTASEASSAPIVAASGSLSPRARRFAEEHNFYPEGVAGTGPGGRILEDDLKRLYYGSPRHSSLARKMIDEEYEFRGKESSASDTILSADLDPLPVKMSSIRERIARRMRESLATTAQYTMNASADATRLLSLRARFKEMEQRQGFPPIHINELVVFCVVKALTAVPEMNVECVHGRIYRHSNVHLGFACETPKGLLVPVIRNCETLPLVDLAMKIRALAKQAVDGVIAPDELSGGTFTVSNLGTYGVESFTPILNPPQVAILGVNAIELKPVRRNATVEFVEHIGLSLTCDHQVIDGAPGARFLQTVKEQIENVESLISDARFPFHDSQ